MNNLKIESRFPAKAKVWFLHNERPTEAVAKKISAVCDEGLVIEVEVTAGAFGATFQVLEKNLYASMEEMVKKMFDLNCYNCAGFTVFAKGLPVEAFQRTLDKGMEAVSKPITEEEAKNMNLWDLYLATHQYGNNADFVVLKSIMISDDELREYLTKIVRMKTNSK